MNDVEKVSSFSYRDFNFPSRYFFAPINTGLASNGCPSMRLIDFYKKRSGKQIGVAYVGNVAINSDSATNPGTLYVTEDTGQFKQLAASIKENGSLAGIQVACMNTSFQPLRTWINKKRETYIDYVRKEILDFDRGAIEEIIEDFIKASLWLIKAGFDIIQIHAAHGYFLANLLNSRFNRRQDKYGNPIQAIQEIIEGIRATSSEKFLLDVRLSLFETDFKENPIVEKKPIIQNLIDIGIDILSFSNGVYNINKQLIYPTSTMPHAILLDESVYFANNYKDTLINCCGNIRNLKKLTRLPNLTFSIGRPLIADEYFVLKSLTNEEHNIIQCQYCNDCHYYSLKKDFISCGVNRHLF